MKTKKIQTKKIQAERDRKKWKTPVLKKKAIKETLNSSGGGGDFNGRMS